MFFEKERILRLLNDIEKNIICDGHSIEAVKMKKGHYSNIEAVDRCNEPWEPICNLDTWGGKNERYWFRSNISLDPKYINKQLTIKLTTGLEDQWDAINPQFLLYFNGEIKQGLDMRHHYIDFEVKTSEDLNIQLDFHGYAGMQTNPVYFKLELGSFNEKLYELYYDIKVPYESALLMDQEDVNRIHILKSLTKAVNMLDFYQIHSKDNTCIQEVRTFLNENIYGRGHTEYTPQVTCVGHTHIDVAWLWTIRQTREKVARSYATVLDMMAMYPEYIFMSSQPQLFQYIKEDHPDLYARLKEKIDQGQWEVEGGMWLEADCNISSGESLIRHILYGKAFMRDEFNRENKTLWLPDVFGYSYALPQILKGFSIENFITTKISWSEYNKMPYDTFYWSGIDGSQVLTHFITCIDYEKSKGGQQQTVYEGEINPSQVSGAWHRYQQKDINNDVLISYGHGDGGGGPTRKMLENARRLKAGIPGMPKVVLDNVSSYMKRLASRLKTESKVPKWVGELYLEYHRGTYTTVAKNKWYNRKSENLYMDLESLSTILDSHKLAIYDEDLIKKGWMVILLNQFHDIIPGTSIKEVYEESHQQYEAIIDQGQVKMKNLLGKIVGLSPVSLRPKNYFDTLLVFNQLSCVRTTHIEYPTLRDDLSFVDEDLGALCYQKIQSGYLLEINDIPGKGFGRVHVIKCSTDRCDVPLLKVNKSGHDLLIESEFYKISLGSCGEMTSIFDKTMGRQLLQEGQVGNRLIVFDDRPHKWEAWDINIHYQEKYWLIDQDVSMNVLENGPLQSTIVIKKRFRESWINQKIIFRKNDRLIEFETHVDWQEKNTLLKVSFPVDIHTDKARYDIQFGNVERSTHWNTSWDVAKFEVCAHKWADLSETGYGCALINDSKYGYDIKNGDMRLSLIKSPTWPFDGSDIGEHNFKYGLYPHEGDWIGGHVVRKGYEFNNDVHSVSYSDYQFAVDLSSQADSMMLLDRSFIMANEKNIVIETIKKSQDGNGIIVRLYETENRRTRFKLSCSKLLDYAILTDMEENHIQDIKLEQGQIQLEIKPYEIITLRMNFKTMN